MVKAKARLEGRKRGKSWKEKLLDDKDLPKVVVAPASKTGEAGGKMVIPAPREVDALMRQVGAGKVVTTVEMMETLRKRHSADRACPLTTGIFSWIAAHAAEEELAQGKKRVTPYWRTLKRDGEVNPKFPGGLAAQRRRLEAEGHRVMMKGKRMFVVDYARVLARVT